jgi:beta-glucosidase
MQRADDLLRTMTIEEKVMQLSALYPMALLGPDGPIKSQLDAPLKQGIGHVSGLGMMGNKPPETIAKTVNAIQRYLVTETRLRIPAIFHNEAANGVVAPHFTPTSRRRSGSRRRGIPRRRRRWLTSCDARCGQSA